MSLELVMLNPIIFERYETKPSDPKIGICLSVYFRPFQRCTISLCRSKACKSAGLNRTRDFRWLAIHYIKSHQMQPWKVWLSAALQPRHKKSYTGIPWKVRIFGETEIVLFKELLNLRTKELPLILVKDSHSYPIFYEKSYYIKEFKLSSAIYKS